MAPSYKVLVWEKLLDADYGSRYYQMLADRNRRLNRWQLMVTAVLTSSAAISLFSPWPTVGNILAVVAAIAAAVTAIFRHGEAVPLAAALARKYSDIESQYEILWLEIEALSPDEVAARWSELQRRVVAIDEEAASALPSVKRLMERAQQQTLVARHLAA